MKFWTVKMPRLVIALLEMSHSLRFTKSVGHVHLPSGAAPGRPFGWLENVCHRGHIKPVSSCLGQQIPGSAGGPSLRRGTWLRAPFQCLVLRETSGQVFSQGTLGGSGRRGRRQVSRLPTLSSGRPAFPSIPRNPQGAQGALLSCVLSPPPPRFFLEKMLLKSRGQ